MAARRITDALNLLPAVRFFFGIANRADPPQRSESIAVSPLLRKLHGLNYQAQRRTAAEPPSWALFR